MLPTDFCVGDSVSDKAILQFELNGDLAETLTVCLATAWVVPTVGLCCR